MWRLAVSKPWDAHGSRFISPADDDLKGVDRFSYSMLVS
jgi:hypothetical protein